MSPMILLSPRLRNVFVGIRGAGVIRGSATGDARAGAANRYRAKFKSPALTIGGGEEVIMTLGIEEFLMRVENM